MSATLSALLQALIPALIEGIVTAIRNWQSAQQAEKNKWTVAAQQQQAASTAAVQQVQFDAGKVTATLPGPPKTTADLKILFGV